jgi:hypothetical protein
MPVDTANYIYRSGTTPNTRSAVSQKNKVFGYGVNGGGFTQIGAVSEFGWDESRTIDPVRGVGFGDQVAELVPSVTEPMTLTLNKTLMYAANLFQVVGYKGGVDGLMRSLRHARWPFDIKQELVFSELASLEEAKKGIVTQPAEGEMKPLQAPTVSALFTYYEGCWFNSWSGSFTQDAAIVAENGSVTVTDILDGISQYGEYIDTGLAIASALGGAGSYGKGYSLRFAGGSNAPTV